MVTEHSYLFKRCCIEYDGELCHSYTFTFEEKPSFHFYNLSEFIAAETENSFIHSDKFHCNTLSIVAATYDDFRRYTFAFALSQIFESKLRPFCF